MLRAQLANRPAAGALAARIGELVHEYFLEQSAGCVAVKPQGCVIGLHVILPLGRIVLS
jgi:hypothetical protein